jgi:Ras-related protein Rab-8A
MTAGARVKVQIWDTAGQERFQNITKNYYRGAHGVLLVYDVTDEKSFANVRSWMAQIREHAAASVNVMLIGNKCDKLEHKVVETARGEALAKEFGVPFLETSAKNNINVKHAFMALASTIKRRVDKETCGGVPTGLDLDRSSAKVGPVRSWCGC